MRTLERFTAAAAVTGLVLAAPVVRADPPALYAGAGAGVADFDGKVNVDGIGDVDLEGHDTAYKLFGGYRTTENFALEGGYRSFGESEGESFRVKTDGWDVSAVGLLLVGPVDVFAKGGVIFWDTKGRGGLPNNHGQDLTWGIGGAVNVGSLWLRVESEWFAADAPDEVQTLTASVAWSF